MNEEVPPTASFTFSPNNPTINQQITFDASESSDPNGEITNYLWDFGDGGSDQGKMVAHNYSQAGAYTVSLTVTDDQNLTSDSNQVVTVRPRLAAKFDVSPPEPDSTQLITFDASGSTGEIVAWYWDLGDSSRPATTEVVGKQYLTNGTYEVTLTVTDDGGLTDTTSQDVVVVRPPEAAFPFTPKDPEPGAIVNFDGSLSTDEDGQIEEWSWDFGDGTGSEGETVSHSYTAEGQFTATLTVRDNDRLTGMVSQEISVEKGDEQWDVEIAASTIFGFEESVMLGGAYALTLFVTNNADREASFNFILDQISTFNTIAVWDLGAKGTVFGSNFPSSVEAFGAPDSPEFVIITPTGKIQVGPGETRRLRCSFSHEWNWAKPTNLSEDISFIATTTTAKILLDLFKNYW